MDSERGKHVSELIAQLESLARGEAAAGRLVACGPDAIPPLRAFLLETQPRSVSQPRCWAVRALAGLGAMDVLVDYLKFGRTTSDPELNFAEEIVQREAALALAAEGSDRAFEVLLDFAAKHPIGGVVEAIGRLERREAVPVLLDACEDDFCRPWALTALARVADRDRDLVIDSVLTPTLVDGEERPRSLRRRRALAEQLRDIALQPAECHRLSRLMDVEDVELAIQGAAIAVAGGVELDAERGRRRLAELVERAPAHLATDVRRLIQSAAGTTRGKGR